MIPDTFFPLSTFWRLGSGSRNKLAEQPVPKTLVQSLIRKEREPRYKRGETAIRIPPWENELGLFSSARKFLSLYSLALSIQMPISSSLLDCQTFGLKLGGFWVSKKLNTWMSEAAPYNHCSHPFTQLVCSLLLAYPT